MARKTMTQMAAEAAMERQAQREQAQAAYPSRLMKALEAATTESNMELKVRNGVFQMYDRSTDEDYTLSPVFTDDAEDVLEQLEYEVRRQQLRREEAARLYALQQQARAKLSKEELAALGL